MSRFILVQIVDPQPFFEAVNGLSNKFAAKQKFQN